MNASNFIKKRSQNRCFLEIICERLLFDFFNGSLLHGPKGSRSRLHDSVRLQGLTHRSSFLFLSVHEPNSPHPPPPPPTCVRKSKTNTFHESIRFLYWLLQSLYQMVLAGLRSFLDCLRLFQLVLDCFSSFLSLVSTNSPNSLTNSFLNLHI